MQHDSADTFSDDSNYEYGDDGDYDVETFGVGAPPLPPPAAAANDDAIDLDVRQMNEEAFSAQTQNPIAFVGGVQPPTQEDIDDALDLYGAEPAHEVAFSLMITRAQQARIYAAHAARAPEQTPEP